MNGSGPLGCAQNVIVIVLAGGMGTRLGRATPKQLLYLGGEPILERTLRRFADGRRFQTVAVVANSEWIEEIEKISVRALAGRANFRVVAGGRSRNESVWNAVQMFNEEANIRCLVHDGVRPLVTDRLINSVLDALLRARAVIPIVDAVDPLFRVVNGRVISVEARTEVFRGQSPQGFWLHDLRFALSQVGIQDMGKFSTLYEVLQSTCPEVEIASVQGELQNLKITQGVDMMTAEQILQGRLP
jgi:2-C-methyl-D-erythritol 4-phosphate cytidylyltransferase